MTPIALGPCGPVDTVTLDGAAFFVPSLGPRTPSSAPSRTAAGGEPPSPVSAPAGTPDSVLLTAGEGAGSTA